MLGLTEDEYDARASAHSKARPIVRRTIVRIGRIVSAVLPLGGGVLLWSSLDSDTMQLLGNGAVLVLCVWLGYHLSKKVEDMTDEWERHGNSHDDA